MGPNGAGKSTLMLHLNGINPPTHGSVRIGGTLVDRKSVKRIRAEVGLVFQDPDDQLFSPTVFEDVAFGPLHMGVPEVEIHERVERALAAVGMTGFERRLPHRLSLGQRKRGGPGDRPLDGSERPGLRRAVGRPRPARPSRADRAPALPRPDAARVDPHDMRLVAEVFPRTVVMDGGEIVGDGPDRPSCWPTTPSCRRTASSDPEAGSAGVGGIPRAGSSAADGAGRTAGPDAPAAATAGVAGREGMISFWPTRMRFGFLMLFAVWIAATVTPYFAAIRAS